MGNIGPLGLYKLRKKCLGVQLQGETMSQYPLLRFLKDDPANLTMTPGQQVNKVFTSDVCQLARFRREIEYLPGQRSYCKASNSSSIQDHRHDRYLLYTVVKRR